jgi:hypothetical protein
MHQEDDVGDRDEEDLLDDPDDEADDRGDD